MTRIGIPRGLLFYRYFPLWETFFEELGVEVVVSHPTTEAVIQKGSRLLPGDLCLPMKIYFGHIESIKEEVDFLFVPRYVSIEPDAYMCPKLIGLPDMVACAIDSLPPRIDLPIDWREHGAKAEKLFYLKTGRIFSKNRKKVEWAYSMGLDRQGRFRSFLQRGFFFDEALDLSRSSGITERKGEDGRMKLGIIGRPYYTHDPFLRKQMIEQVEKGGYQLLTTEALSDWQIEAGMGNLKKKIYWSFGKELVGAAVSFAQNGSVKGIINLASFGCGQDSFNFEMIRLSLKERMPILSLIFDEHLSSVGFSTRIEAFLEMLGRGVNEK
jgi:predicted nucleotide-binding protein (sugar kinase/HSP70/actin superfamily)